MSRLGSSTGPGGGLQAQKGGSVGTEAQGVGLRVGIGYDVHRLEPLAPEGRGRPFVLGGVTLDHNRGPVSHSDGDCLLHAVTDAILGALGLPDIGQLFPDDAAENESRNSMDFLHAAATRARSMGWSLVNVDAVVILQRPKIGVLKEQMAANIAGAMGVDASRVNIKGKTKEEVDAAGQGLAVEVHAVALLTQAFGT